MILNPPATAEDCVARLVSQAAAIQKRADSYSYQDLDARRVALVNCRSFFDYAAMILNVVAHREEGWISESDFRGLIGLSEGRSDRAVEILEQGTRLSLVFLFQFQIENLFKNLLSALGIAGIPRGYHQILTKILRELQLSDIQTKHDTLYTLTMIRNSLHSNGKHTDSSKSVTIAGVTYDFEKDKNVSCAGWSYIIHAADAGLDIVYEILDDGQITALPAPVKDSYVSEIAPQEDP